MNKKCDLCGKAVHSNILFKAGYICKDCISYLKQLAM